ncbi:MAG: transposase [Hadesarchaea archaeon]|nr:transposase [Hadesarchaea archaeon]
MSSSTPPAFGLRKYEVRIVRLEKIRVKQTAKLSLLWDAEKRVFHAVESLPGEAHEMNTLLPMVDSVRVKIRKLFADRGFSSRDNVQGLADRGVDPVIRPQESATPRGGLKYPAWREHITKFKELGYEKWRNETGYGKRFPEEHTIDALINRLGDAIRARSARPPPILLRARVLLHNFFAVLFNGCSMGPA